MDWITFQEQAEASRQTGGVIPFPVIDSLSKINTNDDSFVQQPSTRVYGGPPSFTHDLVILIVVGFLGYLLFNLMLTPKPTPTNQPLAPSAYASLMGLSVPMEAALREAMGQVPMQAIEKTPDGQARVHVQLLRPQLKGVEIMAANGRAIGRKTVTSKDQLIVLDCQAQIVKVGIIKNGSVTQYFSTTAGNLAYHPDFNRYLAQKNVSKKIIEKHKKAKKQHQPEPESAPEPVPNEANIESGE